MLTGFGNEPRPLSRALSVSASIPVHAIYSAVVGTSGCRCGALHRPRRDGEMADDEEDVLFHMPLHCCNDCEGSAALIDWVFECVQYSRWRRGPWR